jgi:hypothetical protein
VVNGVTPGATIDIDVYIPAGTSPSSYLKLQGGAWVELPPSAFDIAGDVVTLHLTDGGVGDEDGDANGTIVDPGAPAVLDKRAPTITCPTAPKVLLNATGATLTVGVSDSGSGVAAAIASVPLATSVAGLRTVAVTAADLAGNVAMATCWYRVVYDVQWVLPLGGTGSRSVQKDTVAPFTFRLADAQGGSVLGDVVGAPTSVATACPSGTPPDMVSIRGDAVTGTLGAGIWVAGWKATKSWKGTCRLVSIPLADGTVLAMVIRVS